jgi:hypothetical protein
MAGWEERTAERAQAAQGRAGLVARVLARVRGRDRRVAPLARPIPLPERTTSHDRAA